MMSDYEELIRRTEDVVEQNRRKEQLAVAKIFVAAMAEAGYTLDTLPPFRSFRAGRGFEDFGTCYGIPIIIDDDAPFVSLVFEGGWVKDE